MTAREYLEQYKDFESRRNRCLSEYKAMSEMIQDIRLMHESTPAKNRKSDTAKYVLYCNDLKHRADVYADDMQRIRQLIESIPGMEGVILKLRYIDGMIWEDIADEIFFSLGGVYKIHRRGLEIVESMLNDPSRKDGYSTGND